jgi:hypothetical protein
VVRMDVRDSYDAAAEADAQHLASELARKRLDRHLLNRFAEDVCDRGVVRRLSDSRSAPAGSLKPRRTVTRSVASTDDNGAEFRDGVRR